MVEIFTRHSFDNPCYPYAIKWCSSQQGFICYELPQIIIKEDYPGDLYEEDFEQFPVLRQIDDYSNIR